MSLTIESVLASGHRVSSSLFELKEMTRIHERIKGFEFKRDAQSIIEQIKNEPVLTQVINLDGNQINSTILNIIPKISPAIDSFVLNKSNKRDELIGESYSELMFLSNEIEDQIKTLVNIIGESQKPIHRKVMNVISNVFRKKTA